MLCPRCGYGSVDKNAPINREKVLLALHTMGCALAEHEHVWTVEDRHIYETALRELGDCL